MYIILFDSVLYCLSSSSLVFNCSLHFINSVNLYIILVLSSSLIPVPLNLLDKWPTDRPTDWPTDQLTDGLTDWSDGLMDRETDGQIHFVMNVALSFYYKNVYYNHWFSYYLIFRYYAVGETMVSTKEELGIAQQSLIEVKLWPIHVFNFVLLNYLLLSHFLLILIFRSNWGEFNLAHFWYLFPFSHL